MMKIPLFKVLMSPEAPAKVAEVLTSGYVAQGPKVDEFERLLRTYLRAHREVLTVNSGTSAIWLALYLAGIGNEDEVVTSAMSCVASTIPIIHLGGIPIWADVNKITGLISPNSIREKITPKTKAILTVDWAGVPCDYFAIRQVLKELGREDIVIIADAAHAFGTLINNSNSLYSLIEASDKGFGSDYVAYSTQAIKILSTGDGGVLICPNKEITARAKKLRWFGFDRTTTENFRSAQKISELGFKFHMNDISAAIGITNLPIAVKALEINRKNALFYYYRFKDLVADERNNEYSRLLAIPPYYRRINDPNPSWWLYTILVDDRDGFETFMKRRGIEVSRVHTRIDMHPALEKYKSKEPLEGLDFFDAHQCAIPVGSWVSEEDLNIIGDAVEDWTHHSSWKG